MVGRNKPLVTCIAMALGGGLSAPTLAQEQKAVLALEEVVVTARRTEEFVQDVPIAISALSADDLQREQIATVQDLQGRIPSMTIGTNSQMRNTETPTIRGQGATFGASPGVIVYWGEVALPGDISTNMQGGPGKFFDLANVQILKGAQGTLFGRNTTGGALLLEPNRPTNNFSARVQAEVSSYDGRGYEAVVNTPLVDDTLLLRLGGQYLDRDGFTKDVANGTDYDNKHYWTSRLGLTWTPTDKIENTVLAYYTDSDDNGTGMVIEGFNPTAGLVRASTILAGPTAQTDVINEQAARDPRHVQLSSNPTDQLKTSGIIDHFSYDLTDTMTLRNILSFSKFKRLYRWDLDGSRLVVNDNDTPDGEHQTDLDAFSEEIQLHGYAMDDALEYVAGAYYESSDAKGHAENTSSFFVKATREVEKFERETYAPFAQATYDLGTLSDSLSGLSLTAGVRYTTDSTKGKGRLTYTHPALPVIPAGLGGEAAFPRNPAPIDADVKDEALTYTVGVDYKFDSHMVYGKVSRGYKGGGITFTAVNPDKTFYDPEFVTNYEIGFKTDVRIGDIPARLNTAAYYTDYDDLQKAGSDVSPAGAPGSTTLNVGKAVIQGVEIDGSIQPLTGLTLSANYSYTDAEYKEFDFAIPAGTRRGTPLIDCAGTSIGVAGGTADLSCIPMQGVAEHQGSVSVRYLLPLDATVGDIETSITYSSSSRKYAAQTAKPENEPGAWLPSYGLLGASISWRNIFETKFDAQLYGTNLTNEEFRISDSSTYDALGFHSAIYSEPRIVGLKVGYHWD